MTDFYYRTEDIPPSDMMKLFAESPQDREFIEALKSRHPAILVGSRGVGKSFLLRVAEQELMNEFEQKRVFPVYVSFVRSSLVFGNSTDGFQHWMLAKLCSKAIRTLEQAGMVANKNHGFDLLAGATAANSNTKSKIEEVAEKFEDSYKNPGQVIDTSSLPSVDVFREALEDLASELKIKRFAFLIDEAAHIFLPEQQRQFFTLFRDLRSHCITCNAAVYPGVTSYGDAFQPAHDASMINLDRDVMDAQYLSSMRQIVEKQAESRTLKAILRNGKNFDILAYSCSGNPRMLLKTIADCPDMSSTEVNEVIRKYYRSNIWSEHSELGQKYIGHRNVIDWGRTFCESLVLPEIKSKNDNYLVRDKNTSCFFWIHRDASEIVKEALRVLSYTGVVKEHESGIKATRGEVGTRYSVNLGCLFAFEATPASTALDIAKSLTPKRMTEYGANHPSYNSLVDGSAMANGVSRSEALEKQLCRNIEVLDLTRWQKEKLSELDLNLVGSVLGASEQKLKSAYYVGDVRARRMKNAAMAAVLEYLSG